MMPVRRNYLDALRLDDKGFVVFGAGEGIARQSCIALAQAGARVLCVDAREEVAAEAAAEVGGIPHCADVTQRADVEQLFAAADAAFGPSFAGIVDVVGMPQIGRLGSFDDETVARQFDLVLRHAIHALQIGGPLLARNGGGSVTVIGSISGVVAIPGQSLYGSAKAALHHLVRCAALELGASGVRVNAVAPGHTQTPRLLEKYGNAQWDSFAAVNPLRRTALPEDIAATVLFLASDLGRYVTGNILTLDGGLTTTVPTAPAPA